MDLEDVNRKAGEDITKIAKDIILSKSYSEGLYRHNRGIRTYYSYTCAKCREISLISSVEAQIYIQQLSRYRERRVTCPLCAETVVTEVSGTNAGAINIVESDGYIVALANNKKTYPDSDIIISCKLDELTSKDLYNYREQYPKFRYDYIEDLADWGNIYNKVTVKAEPKIKTFIESLKGLDKDKLLCYLYIRETDGLRKVVSECEDKDVLEILKRLFNDFIQKGTPVSSISKFKMLMKNKKTMNAEAINNGEVFVVPKSIAIRFSSIDKANSIRKFYNKYDDEKEFVQIMDDALISQDTKYLDALRLALQKTSLSAYKIANICVIQFLFGAYEYHKTCKILSSNAKIIERLNVFQPNLGDLEAVRERNNWIRTNCFKNNNILDDFKSTINKAHPEDEVIILDDFYEMERDPERILAYAENEGMYFDSLLTLYKNNTAYLYTNHDKKYVLCRNNGAVLLESKID